MTVSIGIPFYNPGRAFEKAVRSVFSQTHDDWELILLDDGSSDGSLELARRITDPRVRVLSDGANRGLCARLNQIAQEARHDLLCRMDADDVMHPDRLRRQVEELAAHPEVDVLGTLALVIDPDDRIGGLLGRAFDRTPSQEEALRASLFVHPSVMGRRRWFLENPYDEAYVRAEDQELWCRTAARSQFRALPEPLLFYRQPARINVRSYVATARTVRRLVARYGPRAVGTLGALRLATASYGKEVGHRVASVLALDGPLLALWARDTVTASLEPLRDALLWASRAVVPGWPDYRT